MPVVAAIPAVIAAGGAVFSGIAKNNQAKSQALAAEWEAKQYDVRSKQVVADRTSELTDALSAIEVVRASRNVASNSPTAMAIQYQATREAQDAMDRESLAEKLGGASKRNDASQMRKAGKYALIGGVIEGAGKIASYAASKS